MTSLLAILGMAQSLDPALWLDSLAVLSVRRYEAATHFAELRQLSVEEAGASPWEILPEDETGYPDQRVQGSNRPLTDFKAVPTKPGDFPPPNFPTPPLRMGSRPTIHGGLTQEARAPDHHRAPFDLCRWSC